MSQTYNIVCTQCRQHLWVGQRDYIYSTPEHMSNLASFLHAHLNHPLMFVNEESSALDDSEEQFADDDQLPVPEIKPTQFRVRDDDGQLVDLPGVISVSSDGKEFTLTILDFRSTGFRLIANKRDGDEIAIEITQPSGEAIDSSGYVTNGEFQDNLGAMAEFIFSFNAAKIVAQKK